MVNMMPINVAVPFLPKSAPGNNQNQVSNNIANSTPNKPSSISNSIPSSIPNSIPKNIPNIPNSMPGHVPNNTSAVKPGAVAPIASAPIAAAQNPQIPSQIIGPAYVLEISPEGRSAYEAYRANLIGNPLANLSGQKTGNEGAQNGTVSNAPGLAAMDGAKECRSCNSRKYVDVSNDPSVSFQAPTSIKPHAAAAAVAAHEQEHVGNERAKAARDGREIVSQSVTIKTSVCPECGIVYVSGGETRTVTAAADEQKQGDQDKELFSA